MDFHSVKTSRAAWPASRWPLPVSFVPPNGRCTSAPVVPALMYVIPVCRSRMARNALLTSRVKMEDESPYRMPFATRIASSKSRTLISAVVGPLLKRVVDRLVRDHAGSRGAALARGAECRPDDAFDREVEVGVVEDDDRVLPAELEVDVLQPVGGCLRDGDAGLARTGERDDGYIRVADESVARRLAVPVDD